MPPTYLAGDVQVDGLASGRDVAQYAHAPRNAHLVVGARGRASGSIALHAVRQQELATGATVHVEHLRDETPATGSSRRPVHQEQRTCVAVQQHCQVVDDLLRQRLEVQVGGDVPDHRQEEVPFALRVPQVTLGVHVVRGHRPPGKPHLGVDEQRQHADRTRRQRREPK